MAKQNKSTNKTDPNEKYLLFGFLGLISLHIAGGFWHSNYSWGVSYWSLFDENITITLGIISIVSLILIYSLRSKFNLNFIEQILFTERTKPVSIFLSLIVSIILFSILYLFRSEAHIYGDGYTILSFCSTDSQLVIAGQYKLQFLAVYWHQFMYKLLSPISFLNAENIFAVTNVLGGIIGLWAIIKIIKLISRTSQERLFFLIISLSSASIILFFGYIESYTWASSFMLWSIYYCIRYINKSCSLFPLLLCSFISVAFHLITIPILVTVLYVILYRIELTQNLFVKINRLYMVLFFLIGSLTIMFLSRLYESIIFVPLWGDHQNNYTLFSLSHLSDILNLLLLLAPLGLLFFLFIFCSHKEENQDDDKTEKILFFITLLTFLSACFIDPLIGMIRDWDLLSLYGIPLTIWAGYYFAQRFQKNQFPAWITMASLLIVIIHIVPNLYEKNHPQEAAEYLDKILWEDPHYQEDYDNAYRGNSWAYLLKNNVMRDDLSEKYYARRIDVDQSDPTPLYNLGLMFMNKNQFDSAHYYLQKGYELNPQDPKYLSMFSVIESKIKNYKLAEHYAKEALKIDSNYLPGLTNLAFILREQNKQEEALHYFKKTYDLRPDNYKHILNVGIQYGQGINFDSSYYYLNKAVLLAPENKKADILGNLITITMYMGRKSEAIEYYNQLKSMTTNTTLLRAKEKEIYGR